MVRELLGYLPEIAIMLFILFLIRAIVAAGKVHH